MGHLSKIICHVTQKKEQDRNSHQSNTAALLWTVKSISPIVRWVQAVSIANSLSLN